MCVCECPVMHRQPRVHSLLFSGGLAQALTNSCNTFKLQSSEDNGKIEPP